ncbi:lysozyme inhibitor LprI family protein [Vibrio penaeicida]|uniref:lysozyme inhibitor LprI family protein n=1 Tax=Vibrio penaeicida TaxID=104609 RepID=UPI0027362FBB|nr:lysozyme inhibitor LprI family protein [Vibrio penaeicida]MDP2576038.1 lysozyme inhibitor LprI family protein [Vibrio penaeicida]
MKKVLLISTLFFSCGVVAQDEHSIDVELNECLNNTSTTAGIGNCGSKANEQWDAELNYYYKSLRNELGTEEQIALRDSQRAWIKYRDLEIKNIQLMYGSKRGSMWGLVALSDITNLTKTRAKALKSYYDQMN